MGLRDLLTCSVPVQFPVSSLKEKILSFFAEQEAYVLIWKFHEVVAGKIAQNELAFYQTELQPDYVQEVRVFNEDGELYLVRQEDTFVGRFRRDGEVDNTEKFDVYEERHFVYGRVQTWDNGWLKIADENRGFLFFLPSSQKVSGKVCYIARNYYGCDDDGQLCFKDARLYCFCTQDGTKLNPGGVR